ncbi:YncE family protein [Halalkalicoccus sp. NIPERK01]|uniref:YncE family protein n=1 Tax=Halalkalicoccus sp. NIPERK01 TaxID=3053469 RepID=UPI00256F25EA|nr:hypothetical protein [Halalkalicoccus sp. NIPERK01]MDL5361854.1 hypothetical protein [Halalkalicoccus sp. NIPERK01]
MDTTRRRFVQVAGSGAAVGLAGCIGDDGGDGDDGHDHDDHDHSHEGEGSGEAVGSEGLIYAFAPDTIAVIDPEAGDVVTEISEEIDGAEWGDTRITSDHSRIFANEGATAQVVVIDTETREIADRVDVGPDPTHIYNPVEGEIWTHSDAEGTFYVIDVESLDVTPVEAGLEGEGHGKLLAHEDLGTTAYATNVIDPAVLVMDLEGRARVDEIPLEGEGGTHYKAYAPETGYAYFQRAGGPGGTAVIDTVTNEVVDALEVSGGMYITPDGTWLGVLGEDEVSFLDVTSEESEIVASVPVEGGPDALRYHEVDGTLYGFTANTLTPDASVIDLDAFEEVDRIEVGDIERPEGAEFLHRSGVAGANYFITPADADGTVAIVDMESMELIAQVEVAPGVDTVQFVGDSGSGHTGQ